MPLKGVLYAHFAQGRGGEGRRGSRSPVNGRRSRTASTHHLHRTLETVLRKAVDDRLHDGIQRLRKVSLVLARTKAPFNLLEIYDRSSLLGKPYV